MRFLAANEPRDQPTGTAMEELIYTPGIFDRNSLAAAKQVILTVPRDIADEFWERSTFVTSKLILEAIRPTRDDVLLDFGCGIGRLAKMLIGHTGCRIVGVDISAAMRRYAIEYVGSDRFSVMSSEEFSQLAAKGTRVFSGAYSVIVLQHVLEPQIELRRIAATCKVEAPFFVYNAVNRCVPSNKGWVNDGQDVGRLTSDIFDFLRQFEVPRTMLLYPNQGPLPGEIEGQWFRLFRNKSVVT
jgi:SAM-dependent methyltransferase